MGKSNLKIIKINKGKSNAVGKSKKSVPIKAKKSKSQPKVEKVVKVEPVLTSDESECEEIPVKTTKSVQVEEVDSDDSECEEINVKALKSAQVQGSDSGDSDSAIIKNGVESESDDQEDKDMPSQEDESQDEDDDEEDNDEEEEDDDDEETGSVLAQPVQKIPNSKKSHPAKNEVTRSSDSENPPSARVFVANLSRSSTDESVSSFFMDNGLPATDVYLPKNNNVHKGFAFAEFKDVNAATRAIGLSGSELDGASITICFAKPRRSEQGSGYGNNSQRGESSDSNILFVKNLGPDTTQETLQSHFKNAQEIRVMTDDGGNCRGHAYVEYSSSAEAKSAKDTMIGHKIQGSQIFVDFAKPRGSEPRGGSSFRGRGNSFGGRGNSFGGRGGGFNRDSRGGRGGRGGRGDRGSYNRGGGNFSRGRDNFQGRGGGSRGRGFENRPRGNKIQFHDDD